jgi:nicotinamidase-related amidase
MGRGLGPGRLRTCHRACRRAGFEMYLLREATKPVSSEGSREALEMMQEAGAKIADD